jgi:amidase
MKPTVGLTSRYGVIPISEHQDSPGPMARTVKDAAYLLQAISGVDPSDNYTLANPSGQHPPDYVASCTTSGLRNTRIGVPRNIFSSSTISGGKSQQQEFDKALNILKSAGATIVDPANFGNPASWLFTNPETAILNADFLTNLPSYLSSLQYNPNNITNLAELRDWTRKSPLEEYPRRNTGLWDAILDRQKFKNTDSRFWAAYLRAIDYASTNGLIGTIKREKLDAVVVPAMFASSWAATIGSPLITVPLGVHPDNTRILKSPGGGLVDTAPGIPYVLTSSF